MGDEILYFNEKLLRWELALLLGLNGLLLNILLLITLFPKLEIGWMAIVFNIPFLGILPLIYVFQVILLFFYESLSGGTITKNIGVVALYLILALLTGAIFINSLGEDPRRKRHYETEETVAVPYEADNIKLV